MTATSVVAGPRAGGPLQVTLEGVLGEVVSTVPARAWWAIGVLLVGLVLGYLTGTVNRRLLVRLGLADAVEGTAFERTLQDLGSSTVGLLASLSMYFVWGLAVVAALSVGRFGVAATFWDGVVSLLPRAFVAVLVLIGGIVVGDKLELVVSERLRGYKVPEVATLAPVVKYTVVYVAALVALGQLAVATEALVVLLAAYAFGVVFVGGLAFRDLLASGAAGVWVLMHEPYGIGDQVRVDGHDGIVQEVTVFVTTIETEDGGQCTVPNRTVVREGVVTFSSA
jgi:small-conductance mechanosensitive channel